MQERIVVGVDGSTGSEDALLWALREAARRGSPIEVVQTYLPPVYGDVPGALLPPAAQADVDLLERGARASLEHAIASARDRFRAEDPAAEVHVDAVALMGSTGQVLVERSEGAGLVVVGTHRPGPVRGLLLGSVSQFVMEQAHTTVVLVPSGSSRAAAPAPRKIVVAVDGSAPAQRAVQFACHEARLWGATLRIVHVWDYPYGTFPRGIEHLRSDAQAVLDNAAEAARAEDASLGIETELSDGPIARSLVDAAEGADLLVLGRRGRGGIRSALLGSVSLSVSHHAPGPVAVVH